MQGMQPNFRSWPIALVQHIAVWQTAGNPPAYPMFRFLRE